MNPWTTWKKLKVYSTPTPRLRDGWIGFTHLELKKALQSALTRRYCSGSGSCGSYQPVEPGTFNLENLVAEIEDTMDWKQWILSYLQMAGQYASVFIIIIWTLRIIQRLLAVVSVKKQGFDWRTAVMLNFNLESQDRRTILRNAPAPALDDINMTRSLEPGTLLSE